MTQVTENLTIRNRLGLHARPAALLVQTASKFRSTIELEANGIKVNGKSIMGVMMLAAAHGSELTVIVTGEDATEALAALRALIDSKFDEE